jgi:uncharacterized protein YbaR (Trm112 family)
LKETDRVSDPLPESPGAEAGTETMPAQQAVDPRLLEILVCPLTKQPLIYDRARGELISRAAGLAYPIRGGIPIMLPDEARPIDT